MAEISIVVGTFNRLDTLRKCIESVPRETKRSFHLYVTDAGSTDGTIEYLQSIASDSIRPILVGRKLGQARAYNDVFDRIQTPYVSWISDDNEIVNGGLDLAVDILEQDDRIGMVALKVRDLQGPFSDAPYVGGVSKLGILNVNQGMLRTPVLKAVGGFSEAFRDYGIDPDLTAKVLLCGYDVVYTKPVSIHHYRQWEMDPSKSAHKELRDKHDRANALYLSKYANILRPTPMLLAKRSLWKLIRTALGRRYHLHGQRPFLGLLPRDWNNIMATRFISVFDPIVNRNRPYYLRQRSSPRLKIEGVPKDPHPAGTPVSKST